MKISTQNGNKQQKNKKEEGGECCSPMLLHGNITMCRAGRPRNKITCTEAHKEKLTEEEDEKNEQFSNNEIQGGDVVSWY